MRRLRTVAALAAVVWVVTALPAQSQQTIREKDVNLDESLRLADRLRSRGLTVVMTRTGDTNPTLAQRGRMGGSGDVLISVHNNSSTSAAAHGTEVYAQVANATSGQLAQRIHNGIVSKAGTAARGVKRRRGQNGDYYGVLRNSPKPAVIVEGAFISNPTEARRLSQPDFRQRVAEGIAEGVLGQFVTATPRGAGPPPVPDRLGNGLLTAPAGLSVHSAGRDVRLSWQAVPLATAYQVWRDGNLIATTPAPTVEDKGLSFGGHHYDVRAILGPDGMRLGESPASGLDVAIGKVVIDPGHGGSDPGALGRI